MTSLLTIRRVLTGLALLGLVLSPLVRPAMAMESGAATQADIAADAATDMADMPCCPDKAPIPECGKDCLLMGLCTASVLQSVPQGPALLVPPTLANAIVPSDDADLSGLAQPPPARPPKA